MRRRSPTLLASLTLAAVSFASVARAQSQYDDAFATAAAREAAGRPREAADSLDALAALYPQDFALALRLGWLRFQAGQHAAARGWYQRALGLSGGGSRDARLGLAWAQLRLGATSEALRAFDDVLALDPRDASALEGRGLALAAMPHPVRLWASLWLGGQLYAGHPERSWSLSATASATAQLYDWAVIGATYRAVAYSAARGPSMSSSLRAGPPLRVQHEVHLVAGVARTSWALRAHLGYMADRQNQMAPAWTFGLSGRVALRGELSAELSDTVYADRSLARAVVSWGADLGRGWTLGPVLTGQYTDGDTWGSIGAFGGWRRDGYSLSASARWGDERRPTSLVEGLFYATDDHVHGTFSLSGFAPIGGGFSLGLRYDGLLLSTEAPTGPVDSSAHFITAAITGEW